MQMQILKYVHIKIRKGSKEKSSDHSCYILFLLFFIYNFAKRSKGTNG